jgi:V/A-type H+-transporting ATPase subunit D
MLEFRSADAELRRLEQEIEATSAQLPSLLELLGSSLVPLDGLARVIGVDVGEVNVVGVRLPELRNVRFDVRPYSMLAKPFWVDHLVDLLKSICELRLRHGVQQKRVEILADALRKVTQRVNLFEKVLIPSTQGNIRKINIFLADGQRVAVVRSKIAKAKTVERRAYFPSPFESRDSSSNEQDANEDRNAWRGL